MDVIESTFGEINGRAVKAYTVKNDKGMELTCIEYGCIITKIMVPDKNGVKENVVLGFDTLEEYLNDSSYLGAVIGRISGRIKNAEFVLDNKSFTLAKNENGNNLHGGLNGFHNVVWSSSIEQNKDEVNITFSYTSPDGEEGFPGNLKVNVTYTINNSSQIIISYQAISDKKTIVNLTNHSYFNLSGDLKRTILTHELTLKSNQFLELDSALLPTGNILPVADTVFDFRKSRQVLAGTLSTHPQIELVGEGYDHPFLLNVNNQHEILLRDPDSGRELEIETDQPCVVFYTGNSIADDFEIRGVKSKKHLGLCLETQAPPNMVSAVVLEVEEMYSTKTKYTFNS